MQTVEKILTKKEFILETGRKTLTTQELPLAYNPSKNSPIRNKPNYQKTNSLYDLNKCPGFNH